MERGSYTAKQKKMTNERKKKKKKCLALVNNFSNMAQPILFKRVEL